MGSVPSWYRKLSSTEYLFQIFTLNKEIARILSKKPKKYKVNYADEIIKSAAEALKCAQIANGIYVTGSVSYDMRMSELLKTKGLIDHVSTMSYIFLELCQEVDGISKIKINKDEAPKGQVRPFCGKPQNRDAKPKETGVKICFFSPKAPI